MMRAQQDIYEARKERLGEILVRRHVVGTQQVSRALQVQRKQSRFLGEILTELGYASERDIVTAVAIQYHVPYIAIDKYVVTSYVLDLIPCAVARAYCVMPLDRVGTILSVVMSDPVNMLTKKYLQELTGCMIVSFIATKEEIVHAIDRYYGLQ